MSEDSAGRKFCQWFCEIVRQVSNIDVQPLQSCVRLMCNTRRRKICEVDVSEDSAGEKCCQWFCEIVRQVSNIDVQPLQSCVRLMCNTRRRKNM